MINDIINSEISLSVRNKLNLAISEINTLATRDTFNLNRANHTGSFINVSLDPSVIVPVIGTSITLTSIHKGKILYFSSESNVTVTVDPSVKSDIGFSCTLLQGGLGSVKVIPGSAPNLITLIKALGIDKTLGRGTSLSIFCLENNLFLVKSDTIGTDTVVPPDVIPVPPPLPVITTNSPNIAIDFTSTAQTPVGWYTSSSAVSSLSSNGIKVQATADGWVNTLRSPATTINNGDRVTIDFEGTDGFGVIGLTTKDYNLSTFSSAGSLLLFSNNGGALHNGQVEFLPNAGYSFSPHANRIVMTFLDGAVTVEVLSENVGQYGTLISRSTVRIGIPRLMYGEVQLVVAPYSNGSSITVRQFSKTNTITLPAGVLVSRPLDTNSVGYNVSTIGFTNDSWGSSSVVSASAQAAMLSGTGVVRIGGDEANFYDWNRGGLKQNVAQLLPAGANNGNHTHSYNQQLPIWLAYQDFRVSGTLANIKTFIQGVLPAEVIWCANVVTSTPAYEVARMQDALALGLPVNKIELGNELYFNLTYYAGDSTHPIGHSSASVYALDMINNWIPQFKAAFPGIEIAIPATAVDSRNIGARESEWNYELIDKGVVTGNTGLGAKAFVLHPYYSSTDLGIQKTDKGSVARAEEISRDAQSHLTNTLRAPSLGILPVGGEIWVTEAGLIENSGSDPGIVVAQTWFHGLLMVMTLLVLLKDRRVSILCIHVLMGNTQWEAVTNEDGSGIDPTKRGVLNNPFVPGRHTPLTQTIMGFVLGIAENEALGFGGTAHLLTYESSYIAWRIFNSAKNRILIVNLNSSPKSFVAPTGNSWTARVWTNAPWTEVINVTELSSPVTTNILSGGSVTVPAFSIAVMSGSDELAIDTTPPVVTVTGNTYRTEAETVTHEGEVVTHEGQVVTYRTEAETVTHEGEVVTHEGQVVTYQN